MLAGALSAPGRDRRMMAVASATVHRVCVGNQYPAFRSPRSLRFNRRDATNLMRGRSRGMNPPANINCSSGTTHDE